MKYNIYNLICKTNKLYVFMFFKKQFCGLFLILNTRLILKYGCIAVKSRNEPAIAAITTGHLPEGVWKYSCTFQTLLTRQDKKLLSART